MYNKLLTAEGVEGGADDTFTERDTRKAGLAVAPCNNKGYTTNHSSEAQSARARGAGGLGATLQEKIDKGCQLLRQYVDDHEGRMPRLNPSTCVEGFPLSNFVEEMRLRYKHDLPTRAFHGYIVTEWKLTTVQIEQLEDAGMQWRGIRGRKKVNRGR